MMRAAPAAARQYARVLRKCAVRPMSSAAAASLPPIDSSKLVVKRTTTPKSKIPNDKLLFGRSFSDHMLEVDWDSKSGWGSPVIHPYAPLSLDPAASSLHYALQCFEGMKAYVDSKGRARLFRPKENMKRMQASMKRLQLPSFDEDEFLECIRKLVLLDKDWIPRGDGVSLYIRPTAIATHPFLGVAPAECAKMFCILSPVGPYYPEGFKPVSLEATTRFVRAWPGGTGDTKIGGNYAPTITPALEAQRHGHTQVLWLFGERAMVTEVGTMNLFVLWKNERGEEELLTPPLDGTILPGITRKSILELAASWGEFAVRERELSMHDLKRAVHEGRVREVFGCGTAAVVSPVRNINFEGEDLPIPIDQELQAGPITHRVFGAITDIQYGRVEHEWSDILD